MLTCYIGLYTDESPGLKVDPVVVLVLSLVFIFSVVALHSKSTPSMDTHPQTKRQADKPSYRKNHPPIL